jgi:hypothetical protein
MAIMGNVYIFNQYLFDLANELLVKFKSNARLYFFNCM